jgi:hypothetical protein
MALERPLRDWWQAGAIEQGDRMAARQQRFRDIKPDKAGAANDEDLHCSIRNRMLVLPASLWTIGGNLAKHDLRADGAKLPNRIYP